VQKTHEPLRILTMEVVAERLHKKQALFFADRSHQVLAQKKTRGTPDVASGNVTKEGSAMKVKVISRQNAESVETAANEFLATIADSDVKHTNTALSDSGIAISIWYREAEPIEPIKEFSEDNPYSEH
jgi:hypothetical protein